jgi:hypothetical protein
MSSRKDSLLCVTVTLCDTNEVQQMSLVWKGIPDFLATYNTFIWAVTKFLVNCESLLYFSYPHSIAQTQLNCLFKVILACPKERRCEWKCYAKY